MNRVILIGRLTSDPKINENATCASFRLAVDRTYKREGEPEADFINCKMLGDKKASFASNYLRKGVKIAVTGEIQTGSYEKRDGTRAYTIDVIVRDTEFCESKKIEQSKPVLDDDDFVDVPDGLDQEELPFI